MDIQVKNLQKKTKISLQKARKTTVHILKALKVRRATLSIVFVSRQKIQSLNQKFLNRSYATDVLAFDLRRSKAMHLEGDIVICVDAAKQNAKHYGKSLEEELVLYIVHGILHLMGFDDHKPADIKRMRMKEKEILENLKIV